MGIEYARWMRSKEARAVVWGDVKWSQGPGTLSWWCDADGSVSDGAEILLRLIVKPLRPSEPTILYRCKEWSWRIDHNGAHLRRRCTHIQLEGEPDLFESIDGNLVASPRHGEKPKLSDLESIMRCSAQYLGVNTQGLHWIDLPREVEW